jgi:hypothetical protein
MSRRIAFVLLVYVSLDFRDLNLPGALNFDLDQSVDAVHTQLRGQLPVVKTTIPPGSALVEKMSLPVAIDPIAIRPGILASRMPPSRVRPRALLSNARRPDPPEAH